MSTSAGVNGKSASPGISSGAITLIVIEAERPFAVVAVTTTVPLTLLIAEILPAEVTGTRLVSEDSQVTVLSYAFSGSTVAKTLVT